MAPLDEPAWTCTNPACSAQWLDQEGASRCPACGSALVLPREARSRKASLPATVAWNESLSRSIRQILTGGMGLDGGAHPLAALVGADPGSPATIYQKLAAIGIAVAEPPLPGGQRLGRYRIQGELGRGGMGAVYRAFDPNTAREVAVKRLRPELRGDADAAAKFLAEAQIAAQLEHPNIIPIHEVALDARAQPYFAMKLVEGQTLQVRLQQMAKDPAGQGLSLVNRLRVFLKLCDAVALAHSRGVVHRDLKPENAMVGRFGEVYLMDWGLAKVQGLDAPRREATVEVSIEATHAGSTLRGTVIGTPAYMPPEQARGELERIDVRSDVYSLGAVLYELLALAPPFDGPVVIVLAAVARGEVVPPGERARGVDVPRELEAIVLQAMAHAPKRRYRTVAALVADVEAYLDGHAVSAADYTPFQLAAKWVGRNRFAAAALLAIACALATLGGYVRIQRAERARAAVEAAEASLARIGEADRVPRGKAALEASIEGHLEAVSALDRALRLGASGSIKEQRRDLGRALGERAIAVGDYALARRSLSELARFGEEAREVERLVAKVDVARSAVRAQMEARLHAIVQDVREGLQRSGRDRGAADLEGYVVESLGMDLGAVVKVLGAVADEVADRARRSARSASWSDGERDVVRLCCRVLGRVGGAEPVAPLARLASAVWAEDQVVEVGIALCNTGRTEALVSLGELRNRVDASSAAWRRIRRVLGRIPTADVGVRSPSTAQDFRLRGLNRRDHGDLMGAMEDYTRALALEPDHAWTHQLRGSAYHEQGKLEEALADYDKATEADPNLTYAWIHRARVWLEMRQPQRAILDLKAAIALQPELADSYNDRAKAYMELGQHVAALADLDHAIELDPRCIVALVNRGIVQRSMRRGAEALADFERACELAPDSIDAHAGLAETALGQEKLDQGLAAARRAAVLDPRSVSAWHLTGRLYEKLGRADEAKVAYRRLLELAPEHPDRSRIEKLLAGG